MALRRHRFAVPDHPGISLVIVLLTGLVIGGCGRKEEASFRTIRLTDPAAIASAAAERWEILRVLYPSAEDETAFNTIDAQADWHPFDVQTVFGANRSEQKSILPAKPMLEENRLIIPPGTGMATLIPVKAEAQIFVDCRGSFGSALHMRAAAIPLPKRFSWPVQNASEALAACIARFKDDLVELESEKGSEQARGLVQTKSDTQALLLLIYSPRKYNGRLEKVRIADMGASGQNTTAYEKMKPEAIPTLVAAQTLGKVLCPCLRIPVRTRIEFRAITLPPQPVFRCSLGLLPGMSNEVELALFAEDDNNVRHEVFTWRPSANQKGWTEISRDLPALAEKNVRFVITCDWAKTRTSEEYDASLVFCGAPLVSSKNTASNAPPYNVVLVSLDTLRYDHLGCYGYERPVSPHLDRLAEKGVLFDYAYAQASFTLPSHASLLSSLYPSIHGAEDLTTGKLTEKVTMLAEVLADRGLLTGAFTGGGLISHEFGFHQGFDIYCELDPLEDRFKDRKIPDRHRLPDGSGGSLNLALSWMEDRKDQPFFLFLHTYMVHDFAPPDELAEMMVHEDRRDVDLGMKTLDYLRGHFLKKAVPPRELAYCIDMYDATILTADMMVGALMERLKRLGLDDRTLVLITSDHGEEFQDHDGLLHGCTLYEEMIRVPLIAHAPWPEAPSIVKSPVSQVDIMPTVMDLLGVRYNGILQGRSFLPMLQGQPMEGRPVYAEVSLPGFKNVRCVIDDGWKYLEEVNEADEYDPAEPVVELFHVYNDPQEKDEVSSANAEDKKRLKMKLDRIKECLQKVDEALGLKKGEATELSPELHDFLKELGYM